MEAWKRNLYVVWLAQFMAIVGMSLILPFLPLYLHTDLHVPDASVKLWASFIGGANFACSALIAPFWGSLADRYGRKPMAIRALLGLALSVGLMGYAHSASQLLLLRMLQGVTGGFVSACIALVGTSVPKDRLGSALGFLQSGVIAGHFVGPLMGGVMADQFGFRNVFRITGGILVAVALVVSLAIREEYVPDERARRSSYGENFRMLFQSAELRILFLVIFLSQAGTMMLNPLMALLVKELPHDENILGKLVGLVTAAPAFTSVAAAPLWGRFGDARGHRHVLVIALVACALISPGGALSQAVGPLFLLRFCLGAFSSAVSPTAHTLVGRSADPSRTAGTFSLLTSAQMTGSAVGPFVGGPLATHFGIRAMFLVTAVLLAAAALGATRLRRMAHSGSPHSVAARQVTV